MGPPPQSKTLGALWRKAAGWARALVAKKMPEPSYPPLPLLREDGQAVGVPGLYVLGEVGGTPLIKLGLNHGHRVVDRIADELGKPPADPELYDLIIVGAGAAGLGASARAKERGLRSVTLEANELGQTVSSMTKGKLLLAEPKDVPLQSSVWFDECRREELLARWRTTVQERGLDVRERTKVTGIVRKGEGLVVESQGGSFRARRVVLAIGKAGNPRKAGIPGEREHGKKVSHLLSDPDEFRGRRILVYGGGDVALEAALALCERNSVTLATIDKELTFPKKRNIDALRAKEREGKMRVLMATRLKSVEADAVEVEGPSGAERIPNDHLFEMIGAELPLPFLKKIGLRLEGEWSAARYAFLALCFAVVYLLYAWKSAFPLNPATGEYKPELATFPLNHLYPTLPRELVVNLVRPLGMDPGFWYSALFTVVLLGFGLWAAKRWRSTHQRLRYASLVFFQVAFFLVVNLAAPPIFGDDQAWRCWGLYQPWPLFNHTFYWFQGSVRDWPWTSWFFAGFGALLVLAFMPLLARYQGKRFCSWICGCGGLAETLGDRWRHLSPKGQRSRRWEFQGVVVLVWAALALAATFTVYGGNAWHPLQRAYSTVVDFWLVAVIPVALYPFFGGKVWCRYWCPLAAYNQLLSRWFGRLRIGANDKCINCTLCSRHCQVGVDVMSFAKNQVSFDNGNSSCIQCGICIEVCPMKVLSFESASAAPKPAAKEPAPEPKVKVAV
ncbi:MAG: NAD(P)-binding domain-containing protein [Myxococcales bacterium]|nr:NAD(P)-binding domain-containing protein [Myxococcales bacterium]